MRRDRRVCCVAGASPSVVRAAAMAGVVLLSREWAGGPAAAALGWAVALLLLADPGARRRRAPAVALATAGLIAWATPIGGALEQIGRGRLPAWLTENLGVSLVAQAATLPLILASFGRLSLVAPAVNLLVVPLVAPANGGRTGGARCGRSGGGRRAGCALGNPCVPRLGGAHDHGRDRTVRGRCAVRERNAGPAIERRRGTRECRSRGSGGVAAPAAPTAPAPRAVARADDGARPDARGTRPSTSLGAPDTARAHRPGVVDRADGRGRRRAALGSPDGHGPRRRPGRRYPGAGRCRKPDAGRWRARPRPAAERARRAPPGLGPPDRR